MKHNPKQFDIQDRLLFNLFLDSAVRISAGHSLKLSQLNLEDEYFENVKHKEGYIEPIIFFDETKKLIKEWLKYREENNIVSEYLFLTYYNKKFNHMSKETIRARVRKIGDSRDR